MRFGQRREVVHGVLVVGAERLGLRKAVDLEQACQSPAEPDLTLLLPGQLLKSQTGASP